MLRTRLIVTILAPLSGWFKLRWFGALRLSRQGAIVCCRGWAIARGFVNVQRLLHTDDSAIDVWLVDGDFKQHADVPYSDSQAYEQTRSGAPFSRHRCRPPSVSPGFYQIALGVLAEVHADNDLRALAFSVMIHLGAARLLAVTNSSRVETAPAPAGRGARRGDKHDASYFTLPAIVNGGVASKLSTTHTSDREE